MHCGVRAIDWQDEVTIKASDEYRENAANCAELAAASQDEPTRNRYKRMEAEAAWLALAEEQDWLDGTANNPSGEPSLT
jgi:hypothetical protein